MRRPPTLEPWAIPLVLPLVLVGCTRSEPAPDCFFVDDNGVCQIPQPQGGNPTDRVECELLPTGAIGAEYAYIPDISGSTGDITDFSASGLPAGLSIDTTTGEISGVPTDGGTFAEVIISYNDLSVMADNEVDCGELQINDALNASPLLEMKPDFPCIEPGDVTSKEDLEALLAGGDGTGIDGCSVRMTNMDPFGPSNTCPHGNGNGLMPPGITIDEETCEIDGDAGDIEDSAFHVGTWAWIVQVEQSGFTAAVPYCLQVPVENTDQDVRYTRAGEDRDGVRPDVVTIPAATQLPPDDPNRQFLSYGGSAPDYDPVFSVEDATCNGAPCADTAYQFSTSCSSFDNPTIPNADVNSMAPGGLTHPMTASDDMVDDDELPGRPIVMTWRMNYCTALNGGGCDDEDNYERETAYMFSVIGYPEN